MTIKEKLKNEIDRIPEELAEKVYKIIQTEKTKNPNS